MEYTLVEFPETRVVGMCDRIESTTGECSLKIPNLWRAMLGAPMGQPATPEGRVNEIAGRAQAPYDFYAIYCNINHITCLF